MSLTSSSTVYQKIGVHVHVILDWYVHVHVHVSKALWDNELITCTYKYTNHQIRAHKIASVVFDVAI